MHDSYLRQAVILAGGRGVRLYPLTETLPKPMVLVMGRPFLCYLIEELKRNGIKEIIFLVGYLSEKIIDYFKDGSEFGVSIKYSKGDVDMETGSRLKNAKELLDNKFMLLYCDNFWPIDLEKMIKCYIDSGVLAMTTVYTNKDNKGEYGSGNNIYVDKDNYVIKYDKDRRANDLNGVDIGFFILDKKVLDFMPDTNFSLERETLPLLAKNRQIVAYKTDKKYYYITTQNDIEIIGKFLSENIGRI